MNFKPNLFKTIISFLVGLITFGYIAGRIKCDSPGGCTEAIWIEPLYYAIPAVIFIFVLWSLVQKKK